MARILDRQKAIELRKRGKTYSEIKEKLDVSKSTLSNWLSKYPLTSRQMIRLEESREKSRFVAIEKTRITKARKRDARLKQIFTQEKRDLLPLTRREMYLCGLFLYWGEGVKGLKTSMGLNNTDPKVVKFYLYWLVNILKIPKNKIKVYIHLYRDMNVDKSLDYWSGELNIPKTQFLKPYIKESVRAGLTHKGYGRGTCGLYVHDTRLKEKITLGTKAIANYYSGKIR